MKRSTSRSFALVVIFSLVAVLAGGWAGPARAETFTWTQLTSGGLWSDTANWLGGVAASGTGNTADFNTLDITVNNTVHLDAPVTIGNLVFGDLNVVYPNAVWVLDNNGDGENVLTLAGTAPTITLGPSPFGWMTVTITAAIAGTDGLTKDGPGPLTLGGALPNSYTGATTVKQGLLSVRLNGLLTPTDMINPLSPLVMNGGTIQVTQKNSVDSSQTFANTTIGAGGSTITASNNGGSGTMTLVLGSLTRSSGGMVNFTLPARGAITTTTANGANGILGPWATTGLTTSLQYAANDGSGSIVSYTGGVAAAADLSDVTNATTNYSFAAGTTLAIGSTLTGNTLRYTGAADTLNIGSDANTTNTLTLNGLMNAGSGNLTISRTGTGPDTTGGIVIGDTNVMEIVTNNRHITITAPIKDGAAAGGVTFSSFGGGRLNLNGEIAYTGETVVTSGTLYVGAAAGFYTGGATVPINVTVNNGGVLMGERANFSGNLTLNGGTWQENNGFGGSWTGPVTLGATSTFLSTYNQTVNGEVSGPGGLIKTGNNRLTLNGTVANTYEGPTTITAGTLTVSGAATLGADTGSLEVSNPNTGSGRAVILNLSTTAATTKGSLSGTIATPSSGTNTATINNGGQLFTVNQTSDGAFAGVIAGTGGFTLGSLSTNALTLSGVNTFSGRLTVEGGTLKVATVNDISTAGPLGNNALSVILGRTGGTGTLRYTGATAGSSKPFTMAAGGTGAIQVDPGAAVLTLSGPIDGDGALTKTGAGTLALTGGNTYGGATSVAGGKLLVNNTSGSGTGAGAVTVASETDGSTATLGGTGTISGAVTVSAPAGTGRVNLITGGDIGAMGTLTISGGLSFGAGAIGYFDINSTSDMDYLAVTGDLTAASGTLIQVPAGLTSGTYPLIGYTGAVSDIGNYTLQDLLGGVSPAGYSLNYASSNLNLVISGGVKDCTWSGGGANVKWSTAANWDQAPAATGDTLVFGTPGAGGATLDNDIVGGSFASLQFAGGAPAFTLNNNSVTLTGKGIAKVIIENNSVNNQIVNLPIALGANGTINAASGNIVVGGDISGDFSLTKTGDNQLTLSGANNTYTGGTVIDDGTLVISSSKLGATTGDLTLGGGSLDLGTTSQTVGAVSVTAAAGSGDTIGNGNLTGTSYTVSNPTGDAVISANLLANGSIGLTKTGAGTATLSGSGNTYAGATTVSEGTLKLGVADAIPHGLDKGDVAVGGTLDLNGLEQTINGLTGTGAVTNSNSDPATLTVGDINSSSSFPGAIQDGAGTVALVKIGAGTLTMLGVNTHTGGTVIEAGTLFVNGVDVKLGATDSMNVTIESGAILYGERGNFSGTLTMNGGTWREGNGFGGTWTGPVVLDANSTFQSDYNQTITGNVSGLGGMTKTGNGVLNVNGTNTYSGTTVVNAGTLALANVSSVQSSTLDTGALSASKQVTFTAAGTNTYNIGGLQGGDDLAIGANTISVGANGASTAYSGAISGTGALTKVGGGTLALSGANTYEGGTIVSDGTLLINNATDSGTGTSTVAVNSGTLGGSGTIAGAVAVSDGAHLAPGDGVGTLTVGAGVTMAANSIYDWEFAGSTSTDLVVVTGDLELTSGWTIKLAQAEGIKPLAGSQYDLFTYGTASSISLAVVIDYSGVTNWPNAQIGQDTGAKKIYLKFGILGDTNSDDVVDAADFITLKKNFGAGPGAAGKETIGDFDNTGTVDWNDLSTLMTNMGVPGGAPAMTPEPATLGLLAIGALAMLRRRRAA